MSCSISNTARAEIHRNGQKCCAFESSRRRPLPEHDDALVDEIASEAMALVDELRPICRGHRVHALIIALAEIYGSTLAETIEDEKVMEDALALMSEMSRGW